MVSSHSKIPHLARQIAIFNMWTPIHFRFTVGIPIENLSCPHRYFVPHKRAIFPVGVLERKRTYQTPHIKLEGDLTPS